MDGSLSVSRSSPMKSAVALVVAGALSIGLAACGSGSGSNQSASSPKRGFSEIGSGSGSSVYFQVVNEAPSPVKLVGYIPSNHSLQDSLTKGPAPGEVINPGKRFTFEVTQYFAEGNRLDVVFSWTTNPAIQYRVAMSLGGIGIVNPPVCVTLGGTGCSYDKDRNNHFVIYLDATTPPVPGG